MMSTLKQMVGIMPIERVFLSLVVVHQEVFLIPSTYETSVMHRTRKENCSPETEYQGF